MGVDVREHAVQPAFVFCAMCETRPHGRTERILTAVTSRVECRLPTAANRTARMARFDPTFWKRSVRELVVPVHSGPWRPVWDASPATCEVWCVP
jgi:hypothetical protein